MDTEWIKQKVVTDEANNKKSLDIGAGKIIWPSTVLHHYRGRDRSFVGTVMVELEIPPTAMLNDALDRMVRNETMLLKTGFAILHPEDQFCRKTGRTLAKERLKYFHFNVCDIRNRKVGYDFCHDCVNLLLELSDQNENIPRRLTGFYFELRLYSHGGVVLC
jgi:hypothetical protein